MKKLLGSVCEPHCCCRYSVAVAGLMEQRLFLLERPQVAGQRNEELDKLDKLLRPLLTLLDQDG